MTLDSLKVGEKARLIKIAAKGELHKRLIEMGMLPGTVLGIERIAPFGDPMDIKVRGYHLSIRKAEAALLTVEVLGS
jgi:Fe2+ transport system protein FeoA